MDLLPLSTSIAAMPEAPTALATEGCSSTAMLSSLSAARCMASTTGVSHPKSMVLRTRPLVEGAAVPARELAGHWQKLVPGQLLFEQRFAGTAGSA